MDIKITGRMRLQSSLREPESLKIISEKLVKPGKYGGSVGYEAEYRSKNGFGGYVSETYYTE